METTRKMCITALGIALFVTLSMCLRVPIFENYYLCLGYIIMAIYLFSIDIISGTIVGTFGTILYCLLINGLNGMPGWTLGNIVIGLILGLWFKIINKQNHRDGWIITDITTIIIIIIAVAIGILGIKSITEMFLFSQPFIIRVINNMNAFIADTAVLTISLPICKRTDKILKQENIIKGVTL